VAESARRLLVATTNRGKIAEIHAALADLELELCGLELLGAVPPPEEHGTTFEANALLKARYYRDAACERGVHIAVLAEDSGLEVEAMSKAPGVHSARFLGAETPYPQRHRVMLERLQGEADRTARFVCAAALALPDGREVVVRGTVEGLIATEPRGTHGFGYDPIFLVPRLGKTFGELSTEEKKALSHRGQALDLLKPRLQRLLDGMRLTGLES
jgi:XTP/dITP diphosphohydrolase